MDGIQRKRALKDEALRYLRQAQQCIDPDHVPLQPGQKPQMRRRYQDEGTIEEYEEYVYYNEMELAWGSLESAAYRQPDKDCWRLLAIAAALIYDHNPGYSYFVANLSQRMARNERLRSALRAIESDPGDYHPLLSSRHYDDDMS